MKKASIIISINNTFAVISNFFEMLFLNINNEQFEIIVVDDNSSDIKTIEYIKSLENNNKIDKLISLKVTSGFAKANNIGVSYSNTDCLIFLNSDIIITDNILDKLTDIYHQKEFAAFQPLLLYPQTKSIQSAGHIFANFFNRHALENNSINAIKENNPIIRQALTLAFCIIDKEIFNEVGKFNEYYFNGYEGIELILKISQKYKCAVIPYLYAYHIRSVAIKEQIFDEEQKIPYFWNNCSDIIRNDYVEFIKLYISNKIYENNYLAIQFTYLDLISEVKDAGIKIVDHISIIRKGQIELFSLLPFNLIKTPSPILFLCDNYTQLKNNKLWISIRINENDLIIDSNGNVKSLIGLL